MADLVAGSPVFVRLSGRLGHVVGFVGTDGAGENVFSVRLDDDGATFNAGESSLGDPSEAPAEPVAVAAAEEAPAEAAPEPADSAPEASESEASSADSTSEAETEASSDSSTAATEASE